MSGYDFLLWLRAEGNTTPVIMVTTEAEKRNVIKAIKAGANQYVIKPFTQEVLKKKVECFLKQG